MSDALAGDVALAHALARRAGDLLLRLRRESELTGAALGDAGDREANDLLMRALAEARPEDAVLSEESADSRERLGRSRLWIVDPLDGTREYSDGRDDWAVHVGLAVDGEAVAGAVALPVRGVVYDSMAADLPRPNDPPRLVVSRTRPPAIAEPVAELLGAEILSMGSAGAKAMAVLRGDADIYLHAGGQYEWDNCAPVAVCRAAGLHTSRLAGSPLRYNRPDPLSPDLLICRPELAERVLFAIKSAR